MRCGEDGRFLRSKTDVTIIIFNCGDGFLGRGLAKIPGRKEIISQTSSSNTSFTKRSPAQQRGTFAICESKGQVRGVIVAKPQSGD